MEDGESMLLVQKSLHDAGLGGFAHTGGFSINKIGRNECIMQIQDSGKQLSHDDIAKFEKELGVSLPEDYKEFMLKNNGGMSELDWGFDFFDVAAEAESSSMIQEFLVIYDEETYEDDDLKKIYRILRENGEIPPNILPIADDPSGNLICMSVAEENYGRIFFCDHELEEQTTGCMVMSVVARSFTEFVENCYELAFEE